MPSVIIKSQIPHCQNEYLRNPLRGMVKKNLKTFTCARNKLTCAYDTLPAQRVYVIIIACTRELLRAHVKLSRAHVEGIMSIREIITCTHERHVCEGRYHVRT